MPVASWLPLDVHLCIIGQLTDSCLGSNLERSCQCAACPNGASSIQGPT
jgi:hypothetical protein